ncbi:MAG: hypothetical protein ACRDI2_05155 [Chloroflexota bacterium]
MADVTLAAVMEAARPGLWYWSAPHPHWRPYDPARKRGWDWGQAVGCVCYEAPDALVLIDPLAPPAGTPARRNFWRALDQEIHRHSRPVAVLLTSDWHDRSAQAIFDRYQKRVGASIWAPAAALENGTAGRMACRPTHTFGEGDPLPGGARAYAVAPHWYPEVALYLPPHRALVVADALWRTPDGDVRLSAEKAAVPFRRLLETMPIDMLLLSHGAPVLERARRVLAQALAQPARPQSQWGA